MSRLLRASLVLMATVVTLGALSLAADESRAATAVLKPCAASSNVHASLWYTTPNTPAWRIEAGCPSYAVFRAQPWATGMPLNSFHYLPEPGKIRGQISAVEFEMAGSDGTDVGASQQLRVCVASNCGAIAKPSGPNVNSFERVRLTRADGQIPANANTLRLEGRCLLSPSCTVGRPLELRDVSIEVEDNVQPTVEVGGESSFFEKQPIALEQWNNGVRYLQFTAEDAHSGVHHTKFKVGSANRVLDDTMCGAYWLVETYAVCPSRHEFIWDLNLTTSLPHMGLQQGYNPVEIDVYDAAQNVSERLNTYFLADNLRPVITDLLVSGLGPQGWQSSNKVDLTWRNTGESVETETQSGLTKVRFDLEPLDSGLPNPSALTLNIADFESLNGIDVPANGRWRVSVVVIDRAGNSSLAREATFGVDDVVPAPPEIEEVDSVGLAALSGGVSVNWNPPSNVASIRSGICGYSVAVDNQPLTDPGAFPTVDGSVTSATLPKLLSHGPNYVHVRAVSCSGVASAASHASFSVDAVEPEISVSEVGPNGWYSPSHPLSIAAEEVDGAISLRVIEDGVPGVWRDGSAAIHTPPEGVTELQIEAIDASGNKSTRWLLARYDATGPSIDIRHADRSQPTVFSARVTDQASGVDGVVVEFRSRNGGWKPLPSTAARFGDEDRHLDLSMRIPDSELPDGEYEMRVTTIDRAGISAASQTFDDGSPAGFVLPLRAMTNVTAGFRPMVVERRCKGRGKRKRCRNVRVRSKTESIDASNVAHRRSDRIEGRMLNANGQQLGNRKIDVIESILNQQPRVVHQLTTGYAGEFSYIPAKGPSRKVTFRYAGNSSELPAQVSVRLLVKPAINFKLSRRVARPGQRVVFSGRVIGDGAQIPRSGLNVDVEFRSGRRWLPFTIDAIAGPDGRFRSVHTFARSKSRIKYRFRVRVRWVEGWAYETGYSRTVGLKVRP